ncbi:MAG: hypothetical protein IJH90_07320 [Mogibacterium sp.]|nr:hypothetical protein [Mogibacterium sp.]
MGGTEERQSRLDYTSENWERLMLRLSAGTIQVDRLIEIVIADIAYKSKTRTEARMAAVAKKQAMEESA